MASVVKIVKFRLLCIKIYSFNYTALSNQARVIRIELRNSSTAVNFIAKCKKKNMPYAVHMVTSPNLMSLKKIKQDKK